MSASTAKAFKASLAFPAPSSPPEGLGGVGQVVVACDHLSGTLDTYAYGQHTAAHSESVITCGSTPQKLGRESDLRSAPVAWALGSAQLLRRGD